MAPRKWGVDGVLEVRMQVVEGYGGREFRWRPTSPLWSRPTLVRNVAPGVHRLGHAHVNCYFIVEGDQVTLVDAALPATWRHVPAALEAVGRTPADLVGIVLTHAHFDHVGFASVAQRELGIPVWVHPADRALARHPYRYARERSPLLYPHALPVAGAMVRAGALTVKGIRDVRSIPSSGELDVPGRPHVIETPGHTHGHVALHLPERDTLISGDALVTLDPYTGIRGPQVVARAATADSGSALTSLRRMTQTDARTVLPGHGEPWRGGVHDAVRRAYAAGIA